MRIQEIQRSPIKRNIVKGQRQTIAFGKSNKISRVAGGAIGCLGVFFAIFQIPIIAGLMCLKTHYDFEQERKDDIREDEFKSKNPNKKPFKIYNLSYSECNSSIGGLIAQINEYAIKDNARKVQVGSETTAVLVNSGIYTRLGQNLKKIEYKTTPKYKMVYPDNIISFAHHDEENMRIVIHSYKK